MPEKKSNKYFIVTRYRRYIDDVYVRQYLKDNKNIKYYTTIEKATYDMTWSDTDDSDYGIFSIGKNNNIIRHK
jgi:hypothetical protein